MRIAAAMFMMASVLFAAAMAMPSPNIRGLKARYHPQSSSIFVEWTFTQPTDHVHFNVRYRSNRPGAGGGAAGGGGWKHIRTSETMVRLNLPELEHNDELHVQVNAERGGHIIEDWSQVLVITVTKRILLGGGEDAQLPDIDDRQLLPPVDFTAHVVGTKTVKLEWTPVETGSGSDDDLYYIVNVKQLTTRSGGVLQKQQIKTSATSFTMGKLIPGERYELTIRTAASDSKISGTAAIVELTMPMEDEFFEIRNLIISSLFKATGAGVVNLTWDVPTKMTDKIVGYDVQYAEAGQEEWKTINFDGATATASLTTLRSDTEYLLKIKTLMRNGAATESGQFNFKTPKIQQNPIRKVDVIYSHDVNSVKLQWVLEQNVNTAMIAGYDVYISENKDLPDSQWQHIALPSREAALSLPNLKSLTTYYVRVNVRNLDGSVLRAPSLYRFKTIEPEPSSTSPEVSEANALSYRNLSPGRVAITWTFPESVAERAIGTAIFYTSDKQQEPLEQWHRVNILDPRNTSIVIGGLSEGVRYAVQIVPRLASGDFDFAAKEAFELVTDTHERFEEQHHPHTPLRLAAAASSAAAAEAGAASSFGASAIGDSMEMQQLRLGDGRAFMRITSCDPDAIVAECAWDEVCVLTLSGGVVREGSTGWCIPHNIRDGILNA